MSVGGSGTGAEVGSAGLDAKPTWRCHARKSAAKVGAKSRVLR